ncbi:MAG TPA: carboxylesterase family protein [Vicinamibacterales bacterium]|nr:carboxylesterase family protein [Vicinamibacterales bacterium]
MSDKPSNTPLGRISRRQMLGTTALLGGVVAAVSGDAIGQENQKPATSAGTSAAGPNLSPPIVQTTCGKLRGLREGKTLSFLGVRYAEAERFGLPKAVQPWEGIKNAQVWGPVCPAPEQTTVSADELVFPHRYFIANEHCQYLNVWTQNLRPATKKPVMVWMHGGGFTNGSSMESYAYDGRSLSEFGDVVVVSMNHRLNILGTLDLSAYGPQYANSRYTGTADLVMALQWVKENVEAFGGDPNNVMIFGQSGGGGKVVRMMHMPAAKGLFHRVSAQSGGNNTYRTTDVAASIKAQQTIAAHTLKNLNLAGDQIDKLKTVPYSQLITAGVAALRSAAQEVGRPTLNWEVIADDQYVMREFCDWADGIPLMAGAVFSEMQGTLTRGDGRKNEWSQREIDDQLTAAFADKKNDIVTEFKQAFPRKKVQDVLYYAGTSRPGVKNLLNRKLEKTKVPVYNYLFTWEYPINGGTTSFHCAELAFCFHALGVPQIKTATGGGPVALALQDKVSQAWINFAKTGNPSQPGLEWKPYTKEDPQAMVFDTISQSVSLRDDKLVSLLPAPAGRGGGPGRGGRP